MGGDAGNALRLCQTVAIGRPLFLYGPYRRAGHCTTSSNEAFDASLRMRDPRWGLRNLDALVAAADGFVLDRIVVMPANNLSIALRRRWRKSIDGGHPRRRGRFHTCAMRRRPMIRRHFGHFRAAGAGFAARRSRRASPPSTMRIRPACDRARGSAWPRKRADRPATRRLRCGPRRIADTRHPPAALGRFPQPH